MNVFLSVGSPSNARQKQFSDSVRQFLSSERLTPLTPGQNYALNLQPLKAVEQCMKSCSGVVVLAFERIHIAEGIERRGGNDPRAVDGQNIPTVWNQVEGAMGYARGLPLLVLAEKGLRADALLENKYDWNVQWIDLKASALTTPEFRGVFDDWRSKLDPQPADWAAPDNPADMTVGQFFRFFGRLKTGHAWAMLVAVFTVALGIGTVGFTLGNATARPGAPAATADSTAGPAPLRLDTTPARR